MELPWLSLISFTISLLLSFSSTVQAFKRCPNCGSTRVPYPLSTRLDCGDPDYKIRCDYRGSLWFDTLNGSTNPIKTIDPSGQRFVLRPPGFEPNKCVSVDIKYHGIQLDLNLPFNVSSSNTVIIMNCTKDGLDAYSSQGFNCSDNSLCHKFLNANPEARGNCRGVSSCCWYKTGASVNTYKVYRARPDMCSAYQSFMNLDLMIPVSKWGEPAVEILWEAPREPICKIQRDCKDLVNSVCSNDSTNLGQKRCFCKKGFRWDSVNAVCEVIRCSKGQKCKRWSNLPLIGGLAGGVGAILIAGFVTKTIISKQNRRIAGSQPWASVRKRNSTGLDRIFTGKEIVKATDNFAKSNLLGFGGFGEVFKGNLDDGTTVALTDKSDVYSFGVVLFELLTCKKAIDFNREEEDVNLVVFVRKALKEGRLMDVIDPVIGKEATEKEIESMKELGVLAEWCVKETRQCRPTMEVAAKELESILHGI
ncbi:unnamed protein product [Arabidopsis halleri]